jgi:hypothetical protein
MELATIFHRQFPHELCVLLERAETELDTVDGCQAPRTLPDTIQLDTVQVGRVAIGEQEKDIRFDSQASQDGQFMVGRPKSGQAGKEGPQAILDRKSVV